MANYQLSPSRIARFYYHECERYLRYVGTPAALRLKEGIPPPQEDGSPIGKAVKDEGFVWEEQVVTEILKDQVIMADGEVEIRHRTLGVKETVEAIRHARPGQYIYQPTLETIESFYDSYGIDPEDVELRRCRPDLIQVLEHRGRRMLRVIDVKASDHLKFSHRVQVTLYTLLLQHFLRDRRLTAKVDLTYGGVWLYQRPKPEPFKIAMLRPPIEGFLREDLKRILKAPDKDVHWHLYFRCEWCDWFNHCRQEASENQDASQLPYLSNHARRFLRELPEPVDNLTDLEQLLERGNAEEVLSRCTSLKNKSGRLKQQVTALTHGITENYGAASTIMPVGEHIRVVLTLQREPVGGLVYTTGIYVHGGQGIVDEALRKGKVCVAHDSKPESIRALIATLVMDLSNLLKAVDAYNSSNSEWSARKSLQLYVADSYERDLFESELVALLDDDNKTLAEAALVTLFHAFSAELLKQEDHPEDASAVFPIVVLTGVLRSLFALPIPYIYRFADAVEALGGKFTHSKNFNFELSNQMKSDACFRMWNGEPEQARAIEIEVDRRLKATMNLIQGIRQKAAESNLLFAWPPKFKLPNRVNLKKTTLARIWFFHRYEILSSLISVREARMPPRAERLASGSTVLVQYRGEGRFQISQVSRHARIDADGFTQLLMVRDDVAGERQLQLYKDSKRPYGPLKKEPMVLVKVKETPDLLNDFTVPIDFKASDTESMGAFEVGDQFLLSPRFVDFFSDNIAKELQALDYDPKERFSRIVEDPLGSVGPSCWTESIRNRARDLAKANGMTQSQQSAFERLTQKDLSLVWGPPGTGKTHYLGLAILCLLEAFREEGKNFRIGLTAFTKAALDNLLSKIVSLQEDLGVFQGKLPLARLTGRKPSSEDKQKYIQGVELVWAKKSLVERWCRDQTTPLVVGGTVWQLRKDSELEPFDLLVIDEGSQVKLVEAAIACRRLSFSGTLLIAGDHEQLPPIVQGKYTEPEEGKALYHRSIFECLFRHDSERKLFTSQLLECFRMNEMLCRYPALRLYGKKYRSANPEIAQQKLRFVKSEGDSEWVQWALNPDFPLVVGVLEGVVAGAENPIEASLVAELAEALRKGMKRSDGAPWPEGEQGDADFWKEGLFVVSPHHVQIDCILRELTKLRDWGGHPFVDTVDKMQGQECEAVLISYGVSDPELAMREKHFIYSYQRLNVSLTRARAKTVVFLPRPLIDPPLKAYEDEDNIAGVSFMRGLLDFGRENGERYEHKLGGGVNLVLQRVPL